MARRQYCPRVKRWFLSPLRGKAAVPALQQAVLIDLNRRRRTERKHEVTDAYRNRPDNKNTGQRINA
jgi:hypothetical protein